MCVVVLGGDATKDHTAQRGQTFVCFQAALVEAAKKGNHNRVQSAFVKRKSKVTSCAMLFSPECVWYKQQCMCVVWQSLDCRTQYGSQGATSAKKQCNDGAILFGWGDSLLRDMLDAGVFDCLNGEFGDIQVSLCYCVPFVCLAFVPNAADEPLRWPISVSNLGRTEARKGRASAQASRREGRRPRGSGLLLRVRSSCLVAGYRVLQGRTRSNALQLWRRSLCSGQKEGAGARFRGASS